MSITACPTVLVTGALGHIGSALVKKIIKNCSLKKLIILDNLSTSRYPSLFNLASNFEVKFVQHDVRNDLTQVIQDDIDYVIHLAAFTEPSLSAREPQMFIDHNIKATQSVLNFCKEKKSKFIGISSTSIYGISGNELLEEDASHSDITQSPYSKCKLMEEDLVQEYTQQGVIDATILRFGTIFGVSIGMRFHTAVNKFCWDACMNSSVSVWKTALNQSRPYLDLIDATNAIIFAITNKESTGQTFNVVTCHSTVNEIIDMIREVKPSLKVTLVESPIMNTLSYTLSTSKLKSIGFSYNGSMNYAIRETLQLLSYAS